MVNSKSQLYKYPTRVRKKTHHYFTKGKIYSQFKKSKIIIKNINSFQIFLLAIIIGLSIILNISPSLNYSIYQNDDYTSSFSKLHDDFVEVKNIGISNISSQGSFDVNKTLLNNLTRPLPSQNLGNNSLNITAYWDQEKNRVESLISGYNISSFSQINYGDKVLNKTDIYYYSPNWVNATPSKIKISATIFMPSNFSKYNLSKLPGFIVFHGLFGRKEDMYPFAERMAARGMVIITPDHPGHGNSEGASPDYTNLKYSGAFNTSAHYYLTICAGLQAIRVLRNIDQVDISKIGVLGFSYGALTSLWISSIYSNLINLTIAIDAVGSINLINPNSLWLQITQSTPDEFKQFYEAHGHEFDPIYYLQKPGLPDIFISIGTDDEYFYVDSINATFNTISTRSGNKWLQIIPNGHHWFQNFEGSALYLINAEFFGGIRPPSIMSINVTKTGNLVFEKYKIKLTFNASIIPSAINICFKYKSILAYPWVVKPMEIFTTNETNIYKAIYTINTPIISSLTDFYIIINLNDSDFIEFPVMDTCNCSNAWLTSQIYSLGLIKNNLTFIIISSMVGLIGIPIFKILKQRYRDDVKRLKTLETLEKKIDTSAGHGNNQKLDKIEREINYYKKGRNFFILEISSLIVSEILIFWSLFLPWANMSAQVKWTHIFIFDHIFTISEVFGIISIFIPYLLFAFWIFYGILALRKPILAGILNMGWPLLMFGATVALMKILGLSFELGIIGIGLYLWLIMANLQIIIGIWKRNYQKKLGVRIPKQKSKKKNRKKED
ncbi:MAG: alpha/beta hydrolase family protein [Promethearchaeota archaeon]